MLVDITAVRFVRHRYQIQLLPEVCPKKRNRGSFSDFWPLKPNNWFCHAQTHVWKCALRPHLRKINFRSPGNRFLYEQKRLLAEPRNPFPIHENRFCNFSDFDHKKRIIDFVALKLIYKKNAFLTKIWWVQKIAKCGPPP